MDEYSQKCLDMEMGCVVESQNRSFEREPSLTRADTTSAKGGENKVFTGENRLRNQNTGITEHKKGRVNLVKRSGALR